MKNQRKKFIKLAPASWTPHHTHRIFHISGFLMAIILLLCAGSVFGSELGAASADSNQELSTGVGVTVSEVGTGPISVIGGGGSSPHTDTAEPNSPPSLPAPNSPDAPAAAPVQPGSAEVKVVPTDPDIVQRQIKVNGVSQTQFVFNTQHPKFTGHTNIKNALVGLEIASKFHIRGNVRADSDGNWSWDPVVPVIPDNHTLTVIAVDEFEPQIMTKTIIYFSVELAPGQVVEQTNGGNIVDIGNGGNLFDVIVSIPQQFKSINSGDELVAKIKLVNFGSPGHAVDVEVQYVIRNSAGEVIMRTSQTVAVATQLAFLKTFYPAGSLPAGLYTITVSVPSKDLIATATDLFELKAKAAGPVAALPTTPPIDYSILFQILTAMLLLFSLIAYLEYNKVQILSRTIRQISEKDLIDQV
jgi:hypothetical protein